MNVDVLASCGHTITQHGVQAVEEVLEVEETRWILLQFGKKPKGSSNGLKIQVITKSCHSIRATFDWIECYRESRVNA